MLKDMDFLSFPRKYKKQLLDTGLDSLKITSKKLVHKAGDFSENRIADAVTMMKMWNLLKIQKFLKK